MLINVNSQLFCVNDSRIRSLKELDSLDITGDKVHNKLDLVMLQFEGSVEFVNDRYKITLHWNGKSGNS